MNSNENNSVLRLFETKPCLKVCAPMVRYSKLQFRQLVRLYDCDLAFTPMLLADSFILSSKARNNEFTTSKNDSPLVVQFASNNVSDFVGASVLVSPYCNGVDLNCGCPQRWAKKLGLGCELMNNPEIICSMIKECKSAINNQNFTISVKTRILYDIRKTVDLCQKLDKAGASFLTIHGRYPDVSSGPVNTDAIKLICENVSCPVIANGGVETLDDYNNLSKLTKCNGVMAANGLLSNPTLFTGETYDFRAAQVVVEHWILLCYYNVLMKSRRYILNNVFDLGKPDNITFQCFHHHLVFMLGRILNRKQKQVFNNLKSFSDVLHFIWENNLFRNPPFIIRCCSLIDNDIIEMPLDYDTNNIYVKASSAASHQSEKLDGESRDVTNGKYFNDFTLNELFV
ncbi:tRNA-dihydrouridine(20a/20b) synthase [NAD(P)+]-like isoform X1 [Atheta coriaria]|uniref:tRNA-dihydrouridine(20a/20b) synthase [NAD(P)+]-like isoform X1 n=2 Tax=Dalotia coriaria TaxID=877792 RepID=UPI0031F3C500